jgi:hypothetical protein
VEPKSSEWLVCVTLNCSALAFNFRSAVGLAWTCLDKSPIAGSLSPRRKVRRSLTSGSVKERPYEQAFGTRSLAYGCPRWQVMWGWGLSNRFDKPKFPNQEEPRPGKRLARRKIMTCSKLEEVQRISTIVSCDYQRTLRRPDRNPSKLAGSLLGTKVSRRV